MLMVAGQLHTFGFGDVTDASDRSATSVDAVECKAVPLSPPMLRAWPIEPGSCIPASRLRSVGSGSHDRAVVAVGKPNDHGALRSGDP